MPRQIVRNHRATQPYYRVGRRVVLLTAFVHRERVQTLKMSAAAEPRLNPPPVRESTAPRIGSSDAEFELLVACCSASWNAAAQQNLWELLSSPIRWERLLDLAEHHGVIPCLWARVSERTDCVTAQQFAGLRLCYEQNARRTLWFTRELGRILDGLHSAGVEAVAHKGPALAFMLYGDVTQRQFRDLDLLIHPADVGRAKTALAGLGYQCGRNLSAAQERAYVESGYEHVFHSANGRNLLEMQWGILPRFYSIDFDLPGMFARSGEIKVGEVACRALAPEDLVLALCVHAAKHAWGQLSWLRDLTQLTKTVDLDWSLIRSEAERLGILRIVALNFGVAERLFKSGRPAMIGQVMEEDRASALLADEVVNRVRKGVCDNTESLAYFRWEMQLREHWWDRVRFLWRLACTPGIGEWQSVKLPELMFPLYRMVRVWRLAGRLAGSRRRKLH